MTMAHPFERELSAYIDGELAPGEAEEMRRHVATCPPCQARMEALRETKRLLGALREPAPPLGFEADLLARLAEPARPWWHGRPRPAVMLAAAVLAVVLVAAPVLRDHQDRLRASEVGPDLFVRAAVQSAADDPFMDRAYIGLISTDTNLRLAGEDPRGVRR
jgi:anti-sigma factor RsiW